MLFTRPVPFKSLSFPTAESQIALLLIIVRVHDFYEDQSQCDTPDHFILTLIKRERLVQFIYLFIYLRCRVFVCLFMFLFMYMHTRLTFGHVENMNAALRFSSQLFLL